MLQSKYIVLSVSVNSHMYNLSTSFIPLRTGNHKGMTLGFHKFSALGHTIFSRCDFEDSERGSFAVLPPKIHVECFLKCTVRFDNFLT